MAALTVRGTPPGVVVRASACALAVASLALVAVTTTAPAASAAPASTSRWWGADRYATAAAVSKESFPQGARDVVVVSGARFPDALAAAPLAAQLGGPVLTVQPGDLPEATRAELQRLSPAVIHVVGGTSAVSEDLFRQLQPLASQRVERIQGDDRYGTAARVATTSFADASEVVLASGEDFPDALAGGAAGAALGSPLLLSGRDALPAATRSALTALAPSRVTLVGGTSVVTPTVVAQVKQALPSTAVVRLAGDDRYATAAVVARDTWESVPSPLLASGEAFPDALAGAALGAPLLLARRDCLPAATVTAYKDLGVRDVTAVGGEAALSEAALAATPCR
ncbi:Putative cell wall binding repeat 2 [Quadrisphaera granulorum]|uniref:Putative cell wall binding repeat protein n=1 Tax=Quadrisphaera granulorum TaxID=317664 RepID=A0A315ZT00_9ACTN|nr:cell wall-binding repeat-containing protein [Quadrisphaera granulorum]PWJ47854.1 putative cell wall binding repeat protein [Quadrisphaera granulorum]SZE98621.1 Putative cell wall binding repeat 2 [Quadrisphaera granulorum]